MLFFAVMLSACAATDPAGKPWVRAVELKGVKSIDSDELKAGLATQEMPWYWWFPGFGRQWFDADALDADKRRILRYLRARGMFNVQLTDVRVEPVRAGKAVDVSIRVDEGKKTQVVAVAIDGLDDVTQQERQALQLAIDLPEGTRFDHARYLKGKRLLLNRLRHIGFAYADVNGQVTIDRAARMARIRLTADTKMRVRFGKAQLEGAGTLPQEKLLSLVAWKEGDLYDPAKLTQTQARFYAQRVFSTVQLTLPEKPISPAHVVLAVTPTKLRELRLGGGVGVEQNWQQVHLLAEWTNRNFLGELRELRLTLKPAYVFIPTAWNANRNGPAGLAEARLTQTDFFGSTLTGYVAPRYEIEMQEAYSYHGPRIILGLERSFWETRIGVGIEWNFQLLNFFDTADFIGAENPLGPGVIESSIYRVAWFEPFAKIDLRDDVVDTRAGFYAALRLELGAPQIGSAFTYAKVIPEARGYIPLGTKRVVLALRALYSWLDEKSGTSADTPVTRRLWLGGPNSHRGFGYRRLSPQSRESTQDDTVGRLIPQGGDRALLLSSDLRVRLFRLFGNWLGTVVFVDAGDVTNDRARLEFTNLHVAVGGGLSYLTPIGAAGMSVGVRVNRLDDQTRDDQLVNPDPGQRVAFHLTLGGAF